MTSIDLRERTQDFAVRVVRFVEGLPRGVATDRIGGQLLNAGTSVGSNYRAACLGRSKREFVAKLQIVYEEADESVYWLTILGQSRHHMGAEHDALLQEGRELTMIFAKSLKTARSQM